MKATDDAIYICTPHDSHAPLEIQAARGQARPDRKTAGLKRAGMRSDWRVASIQFENGDVASWINAAAAIAPFPGKFFVQLFGKGKSVQVYGLFKKATFIDGENPWVVERDDEGGFMLEKREPEIGDYDGLQATRIIVLADRAIQTRLSRNIARARRRSFRRSGVLGVAHQSRHYATRVRLELGYKAQARFDG